MNWEDIQRTLRLKLAELSPQEESIRTIVRDVDITIETVVTWRGNARDFWSGILREVRIRKLELKLFKVILEEYSWDETLKKADADFQALMRETAANSTSASASSSDTPSNKPIDGTEPIEVFISYAQDDEKFKLELEKHLKLLTRQNVIHAVHSESMAPGDSRQQDIADLINKAQVILLLISTSFFASDQHYDHEMQLAMKRHDAGAARVIPIILRPVGLKGTPFEGLRALPRDDKPVGTPGNDIAWKNIAEELRLVCEGLRKNQDR